MGRYTTRSPRSNGDDWAETDNPLLLSLAVDDHVAVFTGILDGKGEEIWRSPNPIGFGRNEEW